MTKEKKKKKFTKALKVLQMTFPSEQSFYFRYFKSVKEKFKKIIRKKDPLYKKKFSSPEIPIKIA